MTTVSCPFPSMSKLAAGFVPRDRAITKNLRRANLVRINDYIYIDLGRGRWTSNHGCVRVTASYHVGYGVRLEYELQRFVDGLEALGLISAEERRVYIKWYEEQYDKHERRVEVEELEEKAKKFGYRLVKNGKA